MTIKLGGLIIAATGLIIVSLRYLSGGNLPGSALWVRDEFKAGLARVFFVKY
jgi:hypothetical protein